MFKTQQNFPEIFNVELFTPRETLINCGFIQLQEGLQGKKRLGKIAVLNA